MEASEEVKKILNQFHQKLKSYEIDKKFGQLSIESICHLFPSEIKVLLNYIDSINKRNEYLENLFQEQCSNMGCGLYGDN